METFLQVFNELIEAGRVYFAGDGTYVSRAIMDDGDLIIIRSHQKPKFKDLESASAVPSFIR